MAHKMGDNADAFYNNFCLICKRSGRGFDMRISRKDKGKQTGICQECYEGYKMLFDNFVANLNISISHTKGKGDADG